MAYGLKYTQYVEKDGVRVQIRVYVNGWSGATYGMAHLTGASLQIVGGQSDILTPIIKTSFSFSLADCWDEGTTQTDGTTCVNAQSEKCGEWEEFYTPDATKFRVELWATPSGGTAACIWKGYVTPDSWAENLIYRGSVTITARDMLGALQDKEFDLTGRVSILDIVSGALSACSCPMPLSYTSGHFPVNSNGAGLLSHTIAAQTYSGKTWMQALEDTLESLGLVLRWNGAGGIVLTSLRYLAADTLDGSHAVEFINRSGLRELSPALKSITETFDIEFRNLEIVEPDTSRFSPSGLYMQQNKVFSNSSQTTRFDITQQTLTRAAGAAGWIGNLAVLKPATLGDGVPDRVFYFPTDLVESGDPGTTYSFANSLSYSSPALVGPFRVKITPDGGMLKYNPTAGTLELVSSYFSFEVATIRVRVSAVVSGVSYHLGPDGWGTSVQEFNIAPGEDIEVPSLDGGTAFSVEIWGIKTTGAGQEYSATPANDFFFCTALTLQVEPPTTSTTPTEFCTTTEYDQQNNVIISRTPTIGSAAADMSPDFCVNVLAYNNAIAPDEWRWPGGNLVPLAVLIQAQILVYHSAAASVFTGTLRDKATSYALPGFIYTYYNRNCLPVSGTFDFVSGMVAQANLREFYTWEQVWGTFNPQYTQTSGAGKGSTSATGGGGSSASSGGGGGGTSAINYFEQDGDAVALKSNYASLNVPDLVFGGVSLDEATGVISDALQSLQAQIDAVASHLDGELTAEVGFIDTLASDAIYADTAHANRYYLTDSIYFYTEDVDGTTCVRLNAPFITDGDQIIVSGTPGGGGGGSASYLYELLDVSANIEAKPSAAKLLIFNPSGTDKVGNAGAWEYADTIAISQVSGLQAALDGKQATIADLSTIRSNAEAGRTAYEWGDHAEAGYLLASTAQATYQPIVSDLSTIRSNASQGATAYGWGDTIGEALQSLQAQIDSVASRDIYDPTELTQAALFGINAIGSAAVPVYYDGEGLTACVAGSIFSAFTSSAGTNLSATIAGQTRTATLYATYDSASENIADKFGIAGCALQALQGQVNSLAARFSDGEICEAVGSFDLLAAQTQLNIGGIPIRADGAKLYIGDTGHYIEIQGTAAAPVLYFNVTIETAGDQIVS